MSHVHRAALVGAALALTMSAAPAAPAKPSKPAKPAKGSTKVVKADLLGAAETPQPGDPDGSGRALVRIKGTKVCFTLRVRGVETLNAAHIHAGAAGTAGPVVVGLFTGTPARKGCVTTTADTAARIAASPKDFYVNVHNATYPGGALRGQLQKGGGKG